MVIADVLNVLIVGKLTLLILRQQELAGLKLLVSRRFCFFVWESLLINVTQSIINVLTLRSHL